MNVLKDTTALALTICLQYEDPAGIAVDATCGRGRDTEWLARHFGRVYAFDVQEEAIEATKKRLEEAGLDTVTLIRAPHQQMGQYVQGPVRAVVFNLGYLPGGDKTVTTSASTTVQALQAALDLLAVDGILCVTMYQGHPEGPAERAAVLDWAAGLDTSVYHCVHTDMVNQPSSPPEVLWVTRKK